MITQFYVTIFDGLQALETAVVSATDQTEAEFVAIRDRVGPFPYSSARMELRAVAGLNLH
jgi:hypothetical protein